MVGCREWQERTQDLELGGGASGVSRISARGVVKVRPHTKSGGGGGGGGGGRFRSDIRKVGGGRRFRSDIRKVGGGGGGGRRFRSDIRKVAGGGGGGGGHSAASGPIPLDTQKISTCTYLGILHTRARMNMPAKVNLL